MGKFRSFYTTIEQVGDRHTVPIMGKFRSFDTTIEQVGDRHTVPIMGKFCSFSTPLLSRCIAGGCVHPVTLCPIIGLKNYRCEVNRMFFFWLNSKLL